MTKALNILPVVVLMGLSTALSAQETAQTDEPVAEEAAEAAEAAQPEQADAAQSPSSDLDLGTEVDDPSYIKETYGDWQLQCFRTEAGEDPCQMFQLLREEAGNPVAEFSLFKLPASGQAVAGATIAVPLGTLLPEGLKISVDGGKAKSYNYSFCSMGGCFARIGFTEADIAAFRAGANATLTLVPAQAPDQAVVIKASLSGFTAAYNETSVLEN